MLYVLLIGTVLSSFFGSVQSTMIRVMDPNEYDALLTTLVADFTNVNAEVIVFSIVLLLALTIFLWKDLMLLQRRRCPEGSFLYGTGVGEPAHPTYWY